jgi:hypothetical protein
MAYPVDPSQGALAGQFEPPSPPAAPASPWSYKPRIEHRQTPPLSLVRAQIDGGDDTLYAGQLWDISRSGASVYFGRNSFLGLKGSEVGLRLHSRRGSKPVTVVSRVRWVDTGLAATFVGLQFARALKPGTFLDVFIDAKAEASLSRAGFSPRKSILFIA